MEQRQLHDILSRYWGYDSLRGIQQSVIEAVLENKDVLALMPTGGGKSLCFQVPAMMRSGLCLVVSPLIALMQDQVQHLQQRGIAAIALHSGLNATDIARIYDELEEDKYRFLYVSPERLDTVSFMQCMSRLKVQLLVVDEAHCIAEWGYDFRPAYLNIGMLREELGNVPCLALTASATPLVQKDIIDKLRLQQAEVLIQDFSRPGLSYRVELCVNEADKLEELYTLLSRCKEERILIYARSRKAVEALSAQLNAAGYSSTFYHAGIAGEQREQRQEDWLGNKLPIMVCTSAFGMGVDKPDVRWVVHYGPTDNLESYYQQAGRAGRDGNPSTALLLYTEGDLRMLEKLSGLFYPSFETIQHFYQDLADYLQLPVGLGEDRFFSFRTKDFAERFQWNPVQVHSILKALEQSRLITYLEQVYLPSKLKITASRSQIEIYSEGFPEAGEVLDFLMRHYAHIFIEPVTIRERQIAWDLYLDEARIRHILYNLHQDGYIQYLPARNLPQVHFLTGRAPAGSLLFDHERYQRRKKWFEWRLDMFIRYIQQKDKCRAQMLAAYFGQQLAVPCGICDNCQVEKRADV